ncbi:AAA family ATPase [Wolbachia endosymbiont of Folsomia candida]|uniref:AAA family ATPase n=1 Tax=Wolbachia endosymbiont of Folsomia candida TaxID=169402 RepID=UPI000A997E64|nr:AAA family ATPase [Wolbachia endosymbiont of Folsomia candida]APR98577.1 hypothetical protein ASM33_04970 [Wolbachia endosymbiont of Folsomia candida]
MKKAIDLSKWCAPQKEFVVEDWLSIGDVSVLKGEHEVGKSLLAQQLMTAVATGKPWLNMKVKKARAYGVFFENNKQEVSDRQCAIDSLYQTDESLLGSQMRMFGRVETDNLLMTFEDDVGELTPLFHVLYSSIKLFQPKLVVLDTIADLFGGNKSNPSHLKQFMEGCCAYIAKTLNCAVLVCEHDSSITMCDDRVWHLSRSEIRDERMLYCKGSSHLLRYQDGIFVI